MMRRRTGCMYVGVCCIMTIVLNIFLHYYLPGMVTSVKTFISSVYNSTTSLEAEIDVNYIVPNIVHFIWFARNSSQQITFVNYISILSAHKIHKPDSIYLHCNVLPSGQWWETLRREVSLTLVHREPPTEIFGQRLSSVYHAGDVSKLEIILKYGGIYLDLDVIVINSLNPLRKYDATLGREKPPKFIAGIIIGRKNAEFIRLWYESYKGNYRADYWDYNCARVPYELYEKHPELLHVEPYKLTTPDWTERRNLWANVIDWHPLYVIHIMGHKGYQNFTPENIKSINSTFGQTMRYVYYGTWDVMNGT